MRPGCQVGGDASYDCRPVLPGLRLPIEANAGVPRRIRAIEQPRKIWREGDHGPGWHGKRAGEVERAGAGTDHQVQSGHDCGGVGKIGDLAAKVDDIGGQLGGVEIAATWPDLQDDEVDIRIGEKWGNVGEAGGADAITFGGRVAGPDNADAGVSACNPLAPACPFRGVGV